MTLLDMRTLILSYAIVDIACLMVIVSFWWQTRRRFAGTVFFVFDFVFQTSALFLIILRGQIPNWMSYVLASTMVVGGALLGYIGLERFLERRGSQIHNYVLLAAFALLHVYFTFVRPDQAARNLNASAGLLVICFQCMWLVFRRVQHDMRQLAGSVGIVFGFYCVVNLARVIEYFVGPHQIADYLQSGIFDKSALIANEILFLFLTYCLALMFNKRLLSDILRQEEKYSKAFHSSPYAVILTSLSDGRIIEANEGFLNMTGYQYTDVRDKTTMDLGFWARKGDRAAVIDELMNKGKVYEREFQFRSKSGEEIIGLFSAEIIVINNEKCVLSSINDVTERKRSELQRKEMLDTLRESERRYRSLVENANEAIYVAQNGMIKFINRAGVEMSGYSEEEIISKPFVEFIHPDDRAVVEERYLRRLAGEKPQPHFTFRFIAGNGEIKWLEMGAALINFGGKPASLNIVTDITERKQAEEALKISEDKYRGIFENSIEGVYQTTPPGRYISVNPALVRMLGYKSPEDLMRNITDVGRQLFVNPEDWKEYVTIIEETGVINGFELQVYRKDGSTMWISTNARAIRDSKGNITRFDGTAEDISARRRDAEEITRLNSELERKVFEQTRELRDSQLALLNLVDDLNQSSRGLVVANQALEAVNKELAAFSYSVSHDLRAPLRSVDGFSQALLEDCYDKLDDDGKKYLARIRQATQNMGRLIDDMLNLSRVTQSEFRQEMVDLSKIVHEITNANWQEDSLEHQSFSIQENIIVRGDQRLMHIALTNLLDNAWKFASKQEHPHVEFGFIFKDGKKTIFVRDNGVGFDMKYAGKLFGAFQRLHRADEFPGTGIGLATVQRVINRHGGHIWAESEVGKGATFFFTLPE
jgi:PAS domain S-box-containing protein